jgi:hypothetical protein
MYEREAMLASLDRLEALEQSGARIFFGHDPVFWRTLPQAEIGFAADSPLEEAVSSEPVSLILNPAVGGLRKARNRRKPPRWGRKRQVWWFTRR